MPEPAGLREASKDDKHGFRNAAYRQHIFNNLDRRYKPFRIAAEPLRISGTVRNIGEPLRFTNVEPLTGFAAEAAKGGQVTFANFDPIAQTGTAASRHAVGHGAASQDSYTMSCALQAILTLDQLAFYT